MHIRHSTRAFVALAVLGVIAVFAIGFFVVLGVRSVVADPSGPVPNPGHAWTSIQGHFDDATTTWVSTQNDQAFEVRVNDSRALRLEPDATSPNLIGGYSGNSATAGVVGAAICGGGASATTNSVTDDYGTIGGGGNNQAGDNASTTSNIPYATVGGGQSNTAGGQRATVGGGGFNTASLEYSTVGGGWTNTASNSGATVGGGGFNTATVMYATVGGGYSNDANDSYATVAGGNQNAASGFTATVAGGESNTASLDYATVGGGYNNTASLDYATVGGGWTNTASGFDATVGGGESNTASGYGATVGGGWFNEATNDYATVGGGELNTASLDYATIAGGRGNTASDIRATVGGGDNNTASGSYATVGGGYSNTASNLFATVPGGEWNTAAGNYSFAAGRRAKANNQGCFVWGDSTNADVTCDTNDRFIARASGGLEFYSASDLSDWVKIYDDSTDLITTSTGAHLTVGGVWTDSSDRYMKENFTPVDGQEVLASLADISITTWNSKAQDASVRHMGPTAQDFYAAFGLGEDDRHIASLDSSGVALAAIQGLYELVQEQDARIQALETRVVALEGNGMVSSESGEPPFSVPTVGYALLGGLFVGGLALVQRRRAGGR